MLFNSTVFFFFLSIVFVLYWLLRNQLKWQNVVILISSYIFYGWWDWRFLSLIAISSLVDYTVGIALGKTNSKKKQKMLLAVSIAVNIGILGFFKYFNFFIDSAVDLLNHFGFHANHASLQIILPVGISFYTFQTLSYSIDVYRGEIKPTKDIITFFAFVSFFPQLVAGPIERARNLIPQFQKKRVFDPLNASDGIRQMLWGFFKKIVIADNAAVYVNEIFANYNHHNGGTLLLGAVLFGFQIYGDFSGYSDIAIGTARLFGFNLMQNFAFPYFSRDIAEFWRRWHISLTTWFRDYVYIPLGGSRVSRLKQIRNIFVIFLVSGFWHGANFTFIAWGAAHALMFVPLAIFHKNRRYRKDIDGRELVRHPQILLKIAVTFLLVTVSWIFFRAETIGDAFEYIAKMVRTVFDAPVKQFHISRQPVFFAIILMLIMEWINRKERHGLQVKNWPVFARWFIYVFIALFIFMFGKFDQTEFIYFAF